MSDTFGRTREMWGEDLGRGTTRRPPPTHVTSLRFAFILREPCPDGGRKSCVLRRYSFSPPRGCGGRASLKRPTLFAFTYDTTARTPAALFVTRKKATNGIHGVFLHPRSWSEECLRKPRLRWLASDQVINRWDDRGRAANTERGRVRVRQPAASVVLLSPRPFRDVDQERAQDGRPDTDGVVLVPWFVVVHDGEDNGQQLAERAHERTDERVGLVNQNHIAVRPGKPQDEHSRNPQ
mmetsp:Transcript_3859/g.10666  ORF Transcript_3859/g.10666 Transcript_3859/m.10666 type:complete len:237 (-) Transcript_3859:806-1516(-)